MKKQYLAMVVFALAPAFGATILVNQPLVNGIDGGLFSNDPTQLTADAFSIAGGGFINEAVWYGAAFHNLPFSTFSVEFFASSAGLPGTQLAKFTGVPTMVDQGVVDSYGAELFQFTFDFAGFTADPGVTYFFSASDSGPTNFVWAGSNLPSGGFFSQNGAAGPWNAIAEAPRASQAFTLLNTSASAVPEPGALMLTLTGALMLAVLRRRK